MFQQWSDGFRSKMLPEFSGDYECERTRYDANHSGIQDNAEFAAGGAGLPASRDSGATGQIWF
jgi:hypothetical protein